MTSSPTGVPPVPDDFYARIRQTLEEIDAGGLTKAGTGDRPRAKARRSSSMARRF